MVKEDEKRERSSTVGPRVGMDDRRKQLALELIRLMDIAVQGSKRVKRIIRKIGDAGYDIRVGLEAAIQIEPKEPSEAADPEDTPISAADLERLLFPNSEEPS